MKKYLFLLHICLVSISYSQTISLPEIEEGILADPQKIIEILINRDFDLHSRTKEHISNLYPEDYGDVTSQNADKFVIKTKLLKQEGSNPILISIVENMPFIWPFPSIIIHTSSKELYDEVREAIKEEYDKADFFFREDRNMYVTSYEKKIHSSLDGKKIVVTVLFEIGKIESLYEIRAWAVVEFK